MICFPLDNTPYEAKEMGAYLCTRTRGVYSADGNLAVAPANPGLAVTVSPGLAWLRWSDYWGVAALQETELTLTLDAADGSLSRMDAVVCRLNKVDNQAEIIIKKGSWSSSPTVVAPARDSNYDEIYLATVLVGPGAVSVSASDITDQRLNEAYCGIMRDGVTGIPTEQLQEQVTSLLADLRNAFENQLDLQEQDFDTWFETIKGKLGDDPATALQSQVYDLQAAVGGIPLELSAGLNSVQVVADENRIENVTTYGFTAQEGSGDPSPTNVRPIRNAGAFNGKITITGNESWFQYTDPSNEIVTYVANGIAAGWTTENAANGYCSDYKVGNITDVAQGLRGPTSSNPSGTIIIRDDSVSTLEEFKSKMARIKPVIVYLSTENTGKYYTGISVTQGDNYHCDIIELKALLHEGDTLKTNTLYNGAQKCVETHVKDTIILTGTETISLYQGSGNPIFLIYTSSNWSKEKANNAICNWYPVGETGHGAYWLAGPYGSNPTGTVRLVNNSITTVEDLKSDLASKYAAGTPVTIEYELDQPVVYADNPVTIGNSSGAATIASEGTVSVDLSPLVSRQDIKLLNTFSTVEMLTGETWIDGSPIYQKVYQTGALPDNSAAFIDLDIDALGTVISLSGMATNGTHSISLPYYVLSESSGVGVQVSINNGQIVISTNGNRSSFSGFVAVKYTKQ